MSYIVLARKWRPMTFDDVIGQEHITRTLVNALQQERIAHAFIFSGPRGVGKTTTARLLAKAVNCLNQPATNPCNKCENCLSVTAGRDLDVIEIDGASNRGIDEIRNLRENIRFSPATATHKVYIIDEVHMLSKEAFNALLKTLEEPPSHAIFIFATTEIHKVPITILSRCQRFDFKRIPSRQIADQLQRIAENEKIDIDRESLLLIARKADGGMRDATSILDQLVSYSQGTINLQQVQESLGIIGEELYFQFSNLLLDGDNARVIEFAGEVFHQGYDLLNFVQGLEEHLRNVLLTIATGSADQLETADLYREQYAALAPQFKDKDLLHYLDLLTRAEETLKYSPNPMLYFELLLLKLANKPKVMDIQALLKLLQSSQKKKTDLSSEASVEITGDAVPVRPAVAKPEVVISQPIKSPAPEAEKPPAVTATVKLPKLTFNNENVSTSAIQPTPGAQDIAAVNIDFATLTQGWQAFLSQLRRERAMLATSLQEAIPYQLTGDILEVAFDAGNGFQQAQIESHSKEVEKALMKSFAAPLRLTCLKINFKDKGIEKQVKSPQEAFESLKSQEPLLKKIIDLFDCENLEE